MNITTTHRYLAEILDDADRLIDRGWVVPDWVPAVEFGHLERLRRLTLSMETVPAPAQIVPRWDSVRGAPYIAGFEVCFTGAVDDACASPATVPLKYAGAAVQGLADTLLKSGKLLPEQTFRWRVCAYPMLGTPSGGKTPDVSRTEIPGAAVPSGVETPVAIEPEESLIPIDERSLAEFTSRGHRGGETAWLEEDLPVFIQQQVITQAVAAATRASPLEAGGILLGRFYRDAGDGALFLEVTAFIPARQALAESSSLRFTPASWADVEAAICLRGGSERICGWAHSHPLSVWSCAGCPPERRKTCPSNTPFFSSMDCTVHRTAFQGAFNVALLLSFQDSPEPLVDLFGWRCGMIVPRGFQVLDQREATAVGRSSYITPAGAPIRRTRRSSTT